MSAVLIAILSAVINGDAISAVLAGLTTDQWITLGTGAIEELEPELAKLLGLPKAPSLGTVIDSVAKVASDELAKKAVRDWLSANAEQAMKLQPGAES